MQKIALFVFKEISSNSFKDKITNKSYIHNHLTEGTYQRLVGWLVWGFYSISTFVGYLTLNPFLCKSVLFKTIQFSMSTQFKCQKHFYFKLFKQLYTTIQFSVSTVSMSKKLFYLK